MAKKFENDERYRCMGCSQATPKGEWTTLEVMDSKDVAEHRLHVCPSCGSVVVLSISNVVPEDEEVVIKGPVGDPLLDPPVAKAASDEAVQAAIKAAPKPKPAPKKK